MCFFTLFPSSLSACPSTVTTRWFASSCRISNACELEYPRAFDGPARTVELCRNKIIYVPSKSHINIYLMVLPTQLLTLNFDSFYAFGGIETKNTRIRKRTLFAFAFALNGIHDWNPVQVDISNANAKMNPLKMLSK